MVSGVSAYQQQASIAQSVQPSAKRVDEHAAVARDREDQFAAEAAKRDTVRASIVDNAKKTGAADRDSQQRQAVSATLSSETGAAGKDAAQRRGSLLDITA